MVTFQLGDAVSPVPADSPPFHEWTRPDGTVWTSFYRTKAGYLLRFPALVDFVLDLDGQRVRAWPAPGVGDATIQHLFLNQVLPLAWSKQGKVVLHGSAVEIDDQCVAFIGPSGVGKSTLAASFAVSGFRFLTDDGLILDGAGAAFRAIPNHPSIRLWQDSQGMLIGPDAEAAPPVQFTSKARLHADSGIAFCDQPRPLRRVYFLGEGAQPSPLFRRLKASDALVELIKHSFLLDTEREMLSFHFDALSRLAALPICYRLDYPRRYEALPQLRDEIVRHTAQEGELI